MRKLTRRTRSRRIRLVHVWRYGPVVVVAVFVSAAWMTGYIREAWHDLLHAAVETSRDTGFQVRHVLVSGREKTDRQTLIEALGIEIGEAMFTIDLVAARDRVSTLAWIRDVSIRRRMPDEIVVELVERRPLAVWQNEGEFFVVDSGGEVISGALSADHPDLFLVVGSGAPDAAAELLAVMIRTPDLAGRIIAAVRVGERRWNLLLDGGIDVQLPENGLKDAWHALVEMIRRGELFSRDVVAIDLRLPDRFVVRLTPEARERLEQGMPEGEDT